jgi:hypothetical protein
MTQGNQDEFPAEFHPDRREHGKASQRLSDDQLAELTEEERVAAGIDDYDPGEVPPATDTAPSPQAQDIRQSEQYQEEQAEIRRQVDRGELRDPSESDPFPPTRYED